MGINDLPRAILDSFEVHDWKHACTILKNDFPDEWEDLITLLKGFKLKTSWIVSPGGSKSEIAKHIDGFLTKRGWVEKQFLTKVVVDDSSMDSPTHKVDCYKNKIALEIEWNNKDPFFDRDLNNFRLLFDLRVISVGVIITRCDELQDVFNELDRGSSYGNSTTHMSKLIPRVEGGSGGGCPLLVFGLKKSLVEYDHVSGK